MQNQRSALVYEAVEREAARKAYPEAFPVLPEVPTGRYTEPQFYDLEMRHLWRKTWLHAGHVSELPQPGSYKLFEQLGLSIIISRGMDGELKAFHNICRHRASALLLEKQGTARRFICPYHAWSYSLDGSLTAVPMSYDFACLDKSKRGLLPVRCETLRGMIYINLDLEAQSLADFLAPIERQIGDFPLQDMVVKDIIQVEMDCNWKAAYDNFLEIYHVNTVHAKSIAPYLDSKSFTISLYANGHASFATRKKGGETIFGKGLKVPDGATALFKEHTVALPMFPNGFSAIDPVGFAWQTWWPVGPRKTLMVASLMGWKDDSEADRTFWAGMNVQVRNIIAEDQRLFGNIQRSFDSGVISGVLMGYQERALYWYQEEIDRQIGPENIPAHLRIKPVLGHHVSN
jgi:phenylpropionate dioxygenase-like ring-hydroxylating dioxygenase large terminal subunit